MDTYEGDATVVADGIPYSCHAQLRRGKTTHAQPLDFVGRSSVEEPPGGWSGTLTVEGDAFAVHQAEELQLRINGEPSTFVLALGSDLNAGVLRIRGNNPPPFD